MEKEDIKSKTMHHILEIVKHDKVIPQTPIMQQAIRKYVELTYDAAHLIGRKSNWSSHNHPVRAISRQGHILGQWPTVKKAAEAIGCGPLAISRNIKRGRPMRRNKFKGISWEYIE